MFPNWTFTETDKEHIKQMEDFIPGDLFDSHAHIYKIDNLNLADFNFLNDGPKEVTVKIWHDYLSEKIGRDRIKGGLFCPYFADNCDIQKSNDFLIEQITYSPNYRGLILVSPQSNKEYIDKCLHNKQIIGFKIYNVMGKQKQIQQTSIKSFFPDWLWVIADSLGLVVFLDIVENKTLANEDNRKYIIEKCRKYPNLKLVLKNAAVGFNIENTIKSLNALRGLENIWFDISVICEASAIKVILMEFGPEKLLWGTDFPISEIRGKSVSFGDSFLLLDSHTVKAKKINYKFKPLLVFVEAIKALKDASDDFGLKKEDIRKIFYENALKLIGQKITSNNTQDLYENAKIKIPGGTQLLSKRPELMAPKQWPAYFSEARGCEIWDLDGRHYYDMSTNGIGSCLLGFNDPDIKRAVIRRINLGSMCTLNPPEEVYLADKLIEIHDWADQARFTRTGGEAAAVAIRIARATTDRSIIAICGYHGWHDWYLAANLGESDELRGHLLPGLEPLGVPRELRGTTIAFRYNKKDEFKEILEKYGTKIAAVIMEPCRYNDPEQGFLEYIREETKKHGILLIFDEITIGWRLYFGGAHLKFGVNPDIAIYAKALGNGYPIGAIIGTKEAMEGANSSFISSTYWTEGIGPSAALAVIEKMNKVDVPKHIAIIGDKVMQYWKFFASKHGLPVIVENGYPCLAHFKFDHEFSEELRTLYTQLMLERGFLAGTVIYPTLAHNEEIVDLYGKAIDDVFGNIAYFLSKGIVKEKLKGPVAQSGFKRLT